MFQSLTSLERVHFTVYIDRRDGIRILAEDFRGLDTHAYL
jgi:hypothetical protein